MHDLASIRRFRRFNRAYTKVLGLLKPHLLDSELSLAQARVLYEIHATPGTSATEIMDRLAMDRGQISRILKTLEHKGFLSRDSAPSGRRPVALHVTEAGLGYLADLDRHADDQARGLLKHLDRAEAAQLCAALDRVEELLAPGSTPARAEPVIRAARGGDLGWIVERHMAFYGRENGFGPDFEAYLVCGMAEFLRQGSPRTKVWIAELGGLRGGSVAIVDAGGDRAQLRWLLVEPWAQGRGAGKALVRHALAHCREAGFASVFLWTISIQVPARELYASQGFELAEEKPGLMGGRGVLEEKWALDLNPSPPTGP